jgi:hypothetical protein
MQRSVDGKNYWTFEYDLESPNFARSAFATIAIENGTKDLPFMQLSFYFYVQIFVHN